MLDRACKRKQPTWLGTICLNLPQFFQEMRTRGRAVDLRELTATNATDLRGRASLDELVEFQRNTVSSHHIRCRHEQWRSVRKGVRVFWSEPCSSQGNSETDLRTDIFRTSPSILRPTTGSHPMLNTAPITPNPRRTPLHPLSYQKKKSPHFSKRSFTAQSLSHSTITGFRFADPEGVITLD